MDSIVIEGFRCNVHVGVPVSERQKKQPVLIDLVLGLDLTKPGKSDRVDETMDYTAVVREVKKLVETRSFRLVEAMAQTVANRVFSKFGPERIEVRIRKFSVPGTESVGVVVIRSKRVKAGKQTKN